MDLKEFDYVLPEALIAAYPSRERAASRLLVIRRRTGEIIHSVFSALGEFLDAGEEPKFMDRAGRRRQKAAGR